MGSFSAVFLWSIVGTLVFGLFTLVVEFIPDDWIIDHPYLIVVALGVFILACGPIVTFAAIAYTVAEYINNSY